MKKIIFSYLILSLCLVATPVLAVPNFYEATLSTPGVEKTLMLPIAAVEHSPVISLGSAVDPASGDVVEGYAIIRYKDAKGKPDHAVKPTKPSNDSACYTYLANGAKWKTVEPWLVNPANVSGLTDEFVFNNLDLDISKWEVAASGFDILGDGALISTPLEADTVAPDGLNEVYFGSIEDSNAIAVTIIWGVFGGAPKNRRLVEWDMVYDEVDFAWSATGEADKMDFENIATHELGHSVGMGDLYELKCSFETMYGYASNGETNKRDLNVGDIEGISKLY